MPIFILNKIYKKKMDSNSFKLIDNYSVNDFNNLSKKIKEYEKEFEFYLSKEKPAIVVRLDGCSFKNYTKHLNKPFDERLTKTLVKTTEFLVEKLNANLGYCQSDEITLVFNTLNINDSLLFNGRIQKLCSIVASMASVKFNQFIREHNWNELKDTKHMNKILESNAFFDCRIFNVDSEKDAMECVYWRHNYDCRRNSINQIGFSNFSHKQLNKVSVKNLIDKLKLEKNVDIIRDYPLENIFGSFVKKLQYKHIGIDPVKNFEVETLRTRVETRVLNMSNMIEDERIKFVMSKYWNEIDEIISTQKV